MGEERTQAGITPEAWAAAQVEAVAQEVEAKARRRPAPSKVRGVFFVWRRGGAAVGPKHICAERGCDKAKCRLSAEGRGEWWAQWFDANGGRHREKAGTKAAAVDLYRRRKTEVRQGRHFPERMRAAQSATLKVICDDYVAALAVNRRDRRGQVEVRLAEVCAILGTRTAQSVTPQDLERLKARLSEAKARGRGVTRKPASVNRYLQDLRAAYNLGRRNGKVEHNPAGDVRLLRENNKRIQELTAEEETKLLNALEPRRRGADLRALVRRILETGMRLGEVCALRWSDVDWSGGFATLQHTKAGERQHIPLSAEALATLRGLGTGNGHIFAGKDGTAWTTNFVGCAFAKTVRRVGIPDLRAHDLRHTFACRKLRAGVDLYTVSKLLRHASVVMSERYVHLTRGDLKAAAERSTAISTATSVDRP
ncbi:MAG: site-specific integrase [candidate division NC10 bacterium]|nr:site-specific integrase [candidate division NC10 bacterium]